MAAVHQKSAARTTSRIKLGPKDHGRPWIESDADRVDYRPGFDYEIIDGSLFVSPQPNPPGKFLESWVWGKLHSYSRDARTSSIGYAATRASSSRKRRY